MNPKVCLEVSDSGTPDGMIPQILIAEDDAAIRELLVHHLERDGFRTLVAVDGYQALRLIRSGVTIALLDVGLPGIDGFDIARTLRRENNETAMLFITARVEELDRIIGFELGADDYVLKPFSPREVVARVRAVARRLGMAHTTKPPVVRFGRLEVDETAREARVDGIDIGLKPREFNLLTMFANNAGVALSRDLLIERVWGFDFDGDARTVDVHVRRLRARLHDDLRLPQCIHTVHGFGYKFVLA